jgi:hypothetical protein
MYNQNYIEEAELSYLYNYDAEREDYKLKDVITAPYNRKARKRLKDEIIDKHPKAEKFFNRPIVKNLGKVWHAASVATLVIGGATLAVLGAPALAGFAGVGAAGAGAAGAGAAGAGAAGAGAAGAGAAGAGAGGLGGLLSLKNLSIFKPVMQASLKGKGEQTNGLNIKDMTEKFLKSKGEKSTGTADGDVLKVAGFFENIFKKAENGEGDEKDKFLLNLFKGTQEKVLGEKGFLDKLITGDDAASDTPIAPQAIESKVTLNKQTKEKTETEAAPGKMNIALIVGAAVVLFFMMKKR